MGTRADFYIGRGAHAEWLGSIAWDGYPDGLTRTGVLTAETKETFRTAVTAMLVSRDDGTVPAQGWPWPWNNSHTTDYSYAFDGSEVWVTNYGYRWYTARGYVGRDDDYDGDGDGEKETVFPDMTPRQWVTLGKRSGILLIGSHGPSDAE